MSLANDFREFAQECVRWAGETKSNKHRRELLALAETWQQAAIEAERENNCESSRRTNELRNRSAR
jgi:hypothetical protein